MASVDALTRAPACTWVNADGGYRQDVAFTDDGLFVVTVLPLGPPSACVLVCPPLADDLVRNYRREALLARGLAGRGVAVQRFHHRSTGNSLGDARHLGWSELLDDARAALALLLDRSGPVPVGFFGTRFGALTATALAASRGGAPLALWDPVPDVGTYLRDVVRIERVVSLAQASDGAADDDEGGASTALASRRVPHHLADDASAATSLASVADGAPLGPTLVATLVSERGPRTTQRATAIVRSLASRVDVASYPGEASWWPLEGTEERSIGEAWPVVDETAAWLAAELPGAEPR
jgi:hypothetical protein